MDLQPFGEDTEVIGSVLYHYVDNMPSFVRKPLIEALEAAEIKRTEEVGWVPMKNLLQFYDVVLKKFGPHTVFDIGKIGPEVLADSLKGIPITTILGGFNDIYQSNHRKGYAGFYKMVEHKKEAQQIIMQVYTPYPMMLHKGILTGFGRHYGSKVRIEELVDYPGSSPSEYDIWFAITYRE